MFKKVNFFDNLFDSKLINPVRLLEFGWAVHTALTEANTTGQYTDIIAKLLVALTALKKDVDGVAKNISKQKNNTISVNKFINGFVTFMADNEYVIARAVGGRNTDAYRIIYPFGMKDYRTANKTTMTALTTRVENAGFTYATELGTELAMQLQGFALGYTNAVTAQRLQKTNVKKDRSSKSNAYVQAQWALTSTVHTVAAINGEDVGASAALFHFDMLFTQPKHRRITITETVLKGETKQLLNCTLNTAAVVTIRNTGMNAAVMVWLAANATDAAPADAKLISANSTEVIKASKLGNLQTNSFLMIKNVSDVNEGSFAIEVSGLTKQRSATDANTTDMQVIRA